MKRSVQIWLLAAIVSVTGFVLLLNFQSIQADAHKQKKIDALALEQILKSAHQDILGVKKRTHSQIKAPPFTLKSLEGDTHTIGEATDKPVLINFWASWCEACNVESPVLKRLHEKYKDKVNFYGINITSEEKQPENIAKFMRVNQLTFTTLLDENKRAAYLYELHALPTTFLIDADGYIVDTFHMVDSYEFEKKMERLAN
jgi:thiol-disulfide isomerase/thioredoxin